MKHPLEGGRGWAVLPAGVLALGLAGWMTVAPSAQPARRLVRGEGLAAQALEAGRKAEVHLGKVHVRSSAVTKPPLLERNPFEFAWSGRPAVPARSRAALHAQRPPVVPVPDETRTSPPALIGIAERIEAGDIVRTAIFADSDGAVHFAPIGGAAGLFRVASIEADRVTLVDSRDEASTQVLKDVPPGR